MGSKTDFDNLLEEIGSNGKFQILVLLAMSYNGLVSGLITMQSVFIAYTPQFRCLVYPFDNKTLYPNLNESEILQLTTPRDKDGYDRCSRYSYNLFECNGDFECVNKSSSPMPCDNGFNYNHKMFTETVVIQFDLVCGKQIYTTIENAIFMFGWLFSAVLVNGWLFSAVLVNGYLTDRFGRKPVLFGASFLQSALSGLLILSPNFLFFGIIRFITAASNYAGYVAGFMYVLELVSIRWRVLYGFTIHVSFAISYMLWSGIAYYWRDWKQMQMVTFLITIPLVIFCAILPESARWLFAKRKFDETRKITSKIAKLNGKKTSLLNEDWDSIIKIKDEDKEDKINVEINNESYFAAFKYKRMKWISLNLMFNWTATSVVYYGVSFNAGSLPGNLFINNLYAGVLEIGMYALGIVGLSYIGRKTLLIITLVLAGVSLLFSTAIIYLDETEDIKIVGVVLAFIGKASVSSSFAIIYNLTYELYPTVLRGNSVGTIRTLSFIGNIGFPFKLSLKHSLSWLPFLILGIVALIAGFLSILFPETKDEPMLQTVGEAEQFYLRKSIKFQKCLLA